MQSSIETTSQPHSANSQPDNVSSNSQQLERSDALLQLSRRVDWRFLLPSPALGRVAFFGPGNSEHFKAVQQFCESIVLFDGNEDSKNGKSLKDFDVVVIHSGGAGRLDLAKSILRIGGFVYWEIDRKAWFKRGQRAEAFRRFDYFVKQAKKAGFGEIEVFWHRPNFKSCLEIIPLDDRLSLSAAFSKRGGNFKKQMKFWVGAFLWRSGLLHRVAPCFSVVSKKM